MIWLVRKWIQFTLYLSQYSQYLLQLRWVRLNVLLDTQQINLEMISSQPVSWPVQNMQPSQLITWLLLLPLVWHAPLGVRSAKRRHQSPEWTIMSHSYRLIQWEIVWSQVLLDSLHPRGSRTSWWSPPVLRRGSSYDWYWQTKQNYHQQQHENLNNRTRQEAKLSLG